MDKRKYKNWSNWLIKHGFENLVDENIYKKYECEISFKNTTSFSVAFIKERYFMLFNDEEIKSISETIKNKVMKKRGSSYDPENISKKYSISIEEAEKISISRKKNTSCSLDNFIRRKKKRKREAC